MRVVLLLLVLDAAPPFTRGLPCWFSGSISTSLGCKSANGGEYLLFSCYMKPRLFADHPTARLSFARPVGGHGQSSCPRYPKARGIAQVELQALAWDVAVEPQEADQIPKETAS